MRAEIAGRRWETKTLDALRSVMMVMVFTGHYPLAAKETRDWMYSGGQVGVNGFQAISIATLVIAYYADTETAANQRSSREYMLFFLKRCARLLPLYYACKLVELGLWQADCKLMAPAITSPNLQLGSVQPEPYTSLGILADWLNLGCWMGGAVLPNVHLWFLTTLLWLNALLPWMVRREAQLLRFRPVAHTAAFTLAGGLLLVGAYALYSRELLPLLGVPSDQLMSLRAWMATRAAPVVRVPSMLLTVKATLAVIRGDWAPSRGFTALWLGLLLATTLSSFAIIFVWLRRAVALPAMFDFRAVMRYNDFLSMHLFALAVPMLIYWENLGAAPSGKESACGYQWWLRAPPMRMLIVVSRYSLSFYVWQFVAIRLVQYEQLESAPDFPCAADAFHLPLFASGTGARLYFSSVAHLFTLAVLSHHLLEEPSNTVLKRCLEGWLRSPSAKAKGLELA